MAGFAVTTEGTPARLQLPRRTRSLANWRGARRIVSSVIRGRADSPKPGRNSSRYRLPSRNRHGQRPAVPASRVDSAGARTSANEELQRVNQDLETFAYSASHDLQEPLRTIALCSQMLDRRIGGSLPSEDASFLKTVITSASRVTTLVQDLLAYTKATKHPEGRPTSIDPAPVLASTLDTLRAPSRKPAPS